jgi:hypothetical protein
MKIALVSDFGGNPYIGFFKFVPEKIHAEVLKKSEASKDPKMKLNKFQGVQSSNNTRSKLAEMK